MQHYGECCAPVTMVLIFASDSESRHMAYSLYCCAAAWRYKSMVININLSTILTCELDQCPNCLGLEHYCAASQHQSLICNIKALPNTVFSILFLAQARGCAIPQYKDFKSVRKVELGIRAYIKTDDAEPIVLSLSDSEEESSSSKGYNINRF